MRSLRAKKCESAKDKVCTVEKKIINWLPRAKRYADADAVNKDKFLLHACAKFQKYTTYIKIM